MLLRTVNFNVGTYRTVRVKRFNFVYWLIKDILNICTYKFHVKKHTRNAR